MATDALATPEALAPVRLPERSVRHDLRAARIVWQRELLRFKQDRARMVVSLLQPVLFLFVLGTGLSTLASIWSYIEELKRREDITIFLTTHYMDEAEHCDRIAIIDHGRIVVLDTPEVLKASVGKDRVQIQTSDDQAALAALAARAAPAGSAAQLAVAETATGSFPPVDRA